MSDQERWSDKELRSAVKAYIDIRTHQMGGESINKAAVYKLLAEQHKRSAKAFEYRFQNISYVYSLMGRPWLKGLKPAKNVGAITAAKIEELILLEEKLSAPLIADFNSKVQSAISKDQSQIPKGQHSPKKIQVASTEFVRDPQVVAWVLKAADGYCECCASPAPFRKPTGEPFLEVHHIRRLTDGGSDTITNAVAICPNCHRELHYGVRQAELAEEMYERVSRLIPE